MLLPSKKPPLILLLSLLISLSLSLNLSAAQNPELGAVKGRVLMGIKETPNGGNVTFDCAPSGPCISCSRSEKGDEKYRCGETGYRIRLKCVASKPVLEDAKSVKAQKPRSALESTDMGINQHDSNSTTQRRSLAQSSKSKDGTHSYTTYRSCIPAVNEERLSVIGFEALMLALLLSSGSFIYFRRKRTSTAAGGVPMRLPTNSRF